MGHELCNFGASAEVQDVRTIHVRMRIALKKLMRGPALMRSAVQGRRPSDHAYLALGLDEEK